MAQRHIDTLTPWGKFWWIVGAVFFAFLASIGGCTVLSFIL